MNEEAAEPIVSSAPSANVEKGKGKEVDRQGNKA
jgi:hypothetical protein